MSACYDRSQYICDGCDHDNKSKPLEGHVHTRHVRVLDRKIAADDHIDRYDRYFKKNVVIKAHSISLYDYPYDGNTTYVY